MINLKTIDEEIMDLEKKDTTYAVIERLAWLYTVRDHLLEKDVVPETAKAMAINGDSEFLKAISTKSPEEVWCVIDEFMDSMRVVQPRMYDAIMRKLKG